MKKLFLVPTSISDQTDCIPQATVNVINSVNHFICEKIRSSRRFIKSIIPDFDIDGSHFIQLEKNKSIFHNREIIGYLQNNLDIVLLSEAGNPCLADPGSELVNLARKYSYNIHPLTGPSAILLALISSGLDGQQFTFRGYLPIKKAALIVELKKIEKLIFSSGYTQIFIETPYRNRALFDSIITHISPKLRLSISLGIYTVSQRIETNPISIWQNDNLIRNQLIEKVPCVFLLGQ